MWLRSWGIGFLLFGKRRGCRFGNNKRQVLDVAIMPVANYRCHTSPFKCFALFVFRDHDRFKALKRRRFSVPSFKPDVRYPYVSLTFYLCGHVMVAWRLSVDALAKCILPGPFLVVAFDPATV